MPVLNFIRNLLGRPSSPPAVARPQGGSAPVRVDAGYELYLDPLDSLNLKSGRFEQRETDLCRSLISAGDAVLDVGANIGYFTCLFAQQVGPQGRVFAFEPEPGNFALLSQNVGHNGFGNVRLHRQALSDRAGSSLLFLSGANHGMHRMYDSVFCAAGSVEVETVRGDDCLQGPLDFLKIDIEGFELPALTGLQRTLRESPSLKLLSEFSPMSMLEAGYAPADFLEYLSSLDFKAYADQGSCWQRVEMQSLLGAVAALRIDDVFLQTKASYADKSRSVEEVVGNAAEFLRGRGYHRPVLENLLFSRVDLGPALNV